MLFKRYASETDNRIGAWEFVNVVFNDEGEAREGSGLTAESRRELAEVVKCAIEVEERVERALQYFRTVTDRRLVQVLHELFEKIKDGRKAIVTKNEIFHLLQEHTSEDSTQSSVDLLIKRLNKDKKNGKVTIVEWVTGFTPFFD